MFLCHVLHEIMNKMIDASDNIIFFQHKTILTRLVSDASYKNSVHHKMVNN